MALIPTTIDQTEFRIMRDYIEKQCGIYLTPDKTYLVETRLAPLMAQSGCTNFVEFYNKAVADTTHALRDKIIDAMTTNETLWFRDGAPFDIFRDLLISWAAEMAAGKRSVVRVWCAASSTGQEPYSLAMTALEYARENPSFRPQNVEILATDISSSALFLAKTARYDSIAISRGLPDAMRARYFTQSGRVWELSDRVKKMVTFQKMNLQDSFAGVGRRDIIFCRNVMIYFNDEFKRSVMSRCAQLLRPGGYFIVGASESVANYSPDFRMIKHARGLYYQVK